MNPPEFPAGKTPPSKKEPQLQRPHPPPPRISQESHMIKKPPRAPPESRQQQRQREPVVIYEITRTIHVSRDDFRDVVLRLTGKPVQEEPQAARLASIEKESEWERAFRGGDDVMTGMMEGVVEVGQVRGVLSPEPGALPPIQSEVFSPVSESQMVPHLDEFVSSLPQVGSPEPFPDLSDLLND